MPPRQSKKSAAATTNTVEAVLLTQAAEVKEIKLPLCSDGTIMKATLQAALKKKQEPELLGSYTTRQAHLFLFGYTKGKAGTENKHELPPPHDEVLSFGDILVVASKEEGAWTTPTPFKPDDYEKFYTKAFGGFDETEEGEEEDEEVEEEVEAEEAEVEEAEEEEVEEEEEEEEEEAGEEAGEEEAEAEETPRRKPKIARTPSKKTKKAANANPTLFSNSNTKMNAMTAAIYIPPGEELRDENLGLPLTPPTKLPAERAKTLLSLHKLFSAILSNTEIQELERCIYNATVLAADQRFIAKTWTFLPFVDLYKMTAKSMAANFHPDSYVKNTELYQRYKDGQVGFAEMISMNSYQLFEGRWRDSFVAQQAREKRQLEGNKAMATDRFYCTRCHKRECTYYEMQTRSADEPMTIFITCINCGKHWRQ